MKSNNRYLGALMIAPFIVFVFLGGIYYNFICNRYVRIL